MTTIIITALAAGAAGVLAQAWRTSRATGTTLMQALRAGGRGDSQ